MASPTEHRFLTVEQVHRLHTELLERYGGSTIPGHRAEHEGVAAVVGAVLNSYYDDVFNLAAGYAVYILLGHVFGDGNKRTASASALTFLSLNGIEIDASPKALLELILRAQRKAESDPRPPAAKLITDVAAWLRKHQARE